jgi:hypothetical protein
VSISPRDRKRLWGKSGGRCAKCRTSLTQPGKSGARETVVGVEAHIIGERPGSARYQPLPDRERDAYENRILLCPTDHVVVDAQSEHWTVERLLRLKAGHEQTMTARTADARSDGLRFQMPAAVPLDPVIGGKQLLDIVGPAYAYVFDHDDFEGEAERDAGRALLGDAHDYGEIYTMLSAGERVDAAEHLGDRLRAAMQAGLISYGDRIDVDVLHNGSRDRWPVSIFRVRRAAVVAREQEAAREAEKALRGGGIDGLEAWAEAARARSTD